MSKTKKTAKPAAKHAEAEAKIVDKPAEVADPRPEFPNLEKVPPVSDMNVARALNFAIRAAKELKIKAKEREAFKAFSAKGTKKNQIKHLDLYALLAALKACEPVADILERNSRAVRGYAVQLACWKKRNGKSLTKDERLLAAIYCDADDTGSGAKKPAEKKGGAK